MGHAQGNLHILLDKKDAHAFGVDPLERLLHLFHHRRGKTQKWLVHHQQPRPRHQPTPKCQHLLLPTAQRMGELALAFAQARKQLIDLRKRLWPPRSRARMVAAQPQVLAHR